jgi:peroxiredoxin
MIGNDAVCSRVFSWLARGRSWPVLVCIILGLCMFAAQGTADNSTAPEGTRLVAIDAPIRSLFVLPTLDGPSQELARLRGQVVLVHFFATWCEPCRTEMASLRELQARFAGRALAIVPVSVAEADGAVRRFFASDRPPFAILLDHDRAVARAWSIHTLPSTVILDPGLKPRFMAEGDVDWVRADVLSMLRQLLVDTPG